jgi:hypothetical protein
MFAAIGALAFLAVSGPPAAAAPAGRTTPIPTPTLSLTQTWSSGLTQDIGQPIAESSPTLADLGGTPAVVVGDRRGMLHAFDLAAPPVPVTVPTQPHGWPTTDGSGPIDSSPSVSTSAGSSTIYVGSGDDLDPAIGGYHSFTASGSPNWFTPVVNPPSDSSPAGAVIAGMTAAPLECGTDVYAGSAGQVSYALDATTGSTLTGWPYFNSDSTHSTAATADLYGTGATEIIDGGDQTAGSGRGRTYTAGGHLRILTPRGNLVCVATTNQVIDSSPAVGGFLPDGATGIVTGTGYEAGYLPDASDTGTIKAYDTHCQMQWSTTLDGSTVSSPALADVLGNGSLQVVETTSAGTLWVLNAATGAPIWHTALPHLIVDGSPATADLTGQGYQDIIVLTINGAHIVDGGTGALVTLNVVGLGGGLPTATTNLDPNIGLQNAPLFTDDPNGTIGITLAGYAGRCPTCAQGQVDHFEITGPNSTTLGAHAIGPGSWPEFHHDPQLIGNAGVFSFGSPFYGSMGGTHLNRPIVGMDGF